MKRKNIRFLPDLNTLCYIHNPNASLSQKITTMGLVVSESAGGYAAVLQKHLAPQVGDICIVKVGKLAALNAKCVWVNEVDKDTVKVGFQYME